jgi:hypothetical protein
MLSCRDITELVTEYLEGRMSFGRRMKFHMHVGMCRHCREYLRQMKLTIKTLRRLPADDERPAMPAEVERDLVERFQNWKA